MAKVVMGIGIPGAGKTTALKPFAERNGYIYICPDDIREELSGSALDHARNAEVWELVHARTAEALKEGKGVVVDATFAKDFERKDFIRFSRKSGASTVQGVYADTSFQVAKERNMRREKVVPEHALERMSRFLTGRPPQVDDGFDTVVRINELGLLESGEMMREGRVISKEFKKML